MIKAELGDRFVKSYGAITELADMMTSVEMLKLQLLSQWFYRTGVARVQCKLVLRMPPEKRYIIFTKRSLCTEMRLMAYD